MDHHICFTGHGHMLTSSDRKSTPTFTVPHNFEIVFWTEENDILYHDVALRIQANPKNFYDFRCYKAIYSQGSACPEHILESIGDLAVAAPYNNQGHATFYLTPNAKTKLSSLIQLCQPESRQKIIIKKQLFIGVPVVSI